MSDIERQVGELRAREYKRAVWRLWTLRIVAAPAIAIMLASTISIIWPHGNIRFTPFVTQQGVYEQGGTVVMDNQFCWEPGFSGEGQAFTNLRFFVRGPVQVGAGTISFDHYFPEQTDYTAENDYCAPSQVMAQIPDTLPPGKWAITYEVVYDPTPLPFDTVKQVNTSNVFEIKPAA
jgi:hypothetical protein